MKLEPLLRKGYFPKELPPPFTTKYFAKNFNKIEKSWNDIKTELNRTNPEIYREKYKEKYKSSRCVLYSIPKKISQEEMLKFQILFIIQFYVKQSVKDGPRLTIFIKNQHFH